MKLFHRLAVLMAFTLNAAAQAPSPEPTPQASALDGELFYQLLLGEISAGSGDPGAAYSLMLDAARKTNDAALYQRAIEIALQARSGESALQAAQAWRQAQPASREANLYLLQILVALNRIGETGTPLKALIATTPEAERPATIAGIPQLYARTQDRQLATRLVEQALADEFKRSDTAATAWTTLGRMRLHGGDAAGALDAAQRAQAISPRAEDPVLLALEMMEASHAQAESVVRHHLDGGTVRPTIRLAYAQVLLELDRHPQARQQLERITAEAPDTAQAWLLLGLTQAQDRLPAAEASLQRFLSLAQQQPQSEAMQRGSVQAYLALAQIAERRGEIGAAEDWLDRIDNASELASVQSRRAALLARQGRLKEGRRLLQALPERSPEEARMKLMAEVQLLRDNKQLRAAYELLAKGLARTPQDTDLIYEQALLAEKLGRPQEMERLLRQLIALDPNHFHAYNALGYSLADRNLRLAEARELIDKAVALAPNDPFIQDSLGWVTFRQGQTAEALRVLESAFAARPDAEIAAHLGEVLWALGQRERATAIWREGLRLNPDNDTLTQTLRRLRVRL